LKPPEPPDRPPPRDDLHGPGGCGFSGCAFALVALFAVLLAVMVALALLRPWPTPLIPGR
jgi:hypothetical protein